MSMRMTQQIQIGLLVGLVLLGITLFGKGFYMQAKAHFAQYLIEQAWAKTLIDGQSHKPWSWADTYPVAKLSIEQAKRPNHFDGPASNDSLYVLAGASGRNLAFGPALVLSSAPAGAQGNTVIAGHRDTHFAMLNGISVGRRLALQTATEELGREVNPNIYTPQDFAKRLSEGGSFVSRVMAQPKIWLIGGPDDLAL